MSRVDDVLALAATEIGKPYIYGDEGPSSFDCSGLVQFVYGNVGVTLPRVAAEQQRATTRVTNPLPGDLVFYGSPAHHVGIYLGGGKMINAPDVNQRVRIDNVGTPTNYGRVAGLGTLAAIPVAAVTAGAGAVSDKVTSILGGARHIVIEAAAVGLGLALVGYGLWRATAAPRAAAGDAVFETIGKVI